MQPVAPVRALLCLHQRARMLPVGSTQRSLLPSAGFGKCELGWERAKLSACFACCWVRENWSLLLIMCRNRCSIQVSHKVYACLLFSVIPLLYKGWQRGGKIIAAVFYLPTSLWNHFLWILRSLLWRWLFRLGAVSSRISGSVTAVPGLSILVWCILFIDLWVLRHRQVLNT